MANVSSSNSQKALVPKLRFPGFDGEWQYVKLSDIAEGFDYGLNAAAVEYDGERKYIRITDIDENSHKYIAEQKVSPKGATEEQYRVCANDILFARTGASVGKTYLYDTNDGLLYFAGFLIRAKITRANARFVFAQTLTEKYNRWVATTSMRSGQPGINAKEYETLPISITDAVEQNKISNFLTQLDLRIDKQRSLINTLKLYKRGLVRRIFPHTESLQPELRMTTYSGPWQSAKIGDIGSVLMCKRIYKEQTSTSGDVPFYKIGTFGGTADSYIPRELFLEYKAKYPYPQKGDVLISASGSIGRTVVFSGQDEYFQDSNIIWVKFDGTIGNIYAHSFIGKGLKVAR